MRSSTSPSTRARCTSSTAPRACGSAEPPQPTPRGGLPGSRVTRDRSAPPGAGRFPVVRGCRAASSRETTAHACRGSVPPATRSLRTAVAVVCAVALAGCSSGSGTGEAQVTYAPQHRKAAPDLAGATLKGGTSPSPPSAATSSWSTSGPRGATPAATRPIPRPGRDRPRAPRVSLHRHRVPRRRQGQRPRLPAQPRRPVRQPLRPGQPVRAPARRQGLGRRAAADDDHPSRAASPRS